MLKKKECAGPVPARDESGIESPLAEGGIDAAVQPELRDSQRITDDQTNSSATEIFETEVSAHNVAVTECPTIPDI
ncbi:MAG: hypothetical protein WC620_11240 [Methanoregula sp.]|jgi:hypothetical protein